MQTNAHSTYLRPPPVLALDALALVGPGHDGHGVLERLDDHARPPVALEHGVARMHSPLDGALGHHGGAVLPVLVVVEVAARPVADEVGRLDGVQRVEQRGQLARVDGAGGVVDQVEDAHFWAVGGGREGAVVSFGVVWRCIFLWVRLVSDEAIGEESKEKLREQRDDKIAGNQGMGVAGGGGLVVLVGIKSKRAQATRCSGRPTNPWLVAFLSATQRFG